MTSERVERRLAAVLAADVAGYSRLMGIDEEGTLARLKAARKALVDPAIASYRGHIVKTTGDGMLVEFASAVDAVRGAVEVQRGMAEHNASVPQDQPLEFRIGIHVGDIIFDDSDIFGDGVNIAARLEGISEPGGVCISDDTHRQIRGKVDFAFDDMGPQMLKNIAEPMRAWRLILGGHSAVTTKPVSPSSPAPALLPDKPSIAVLPFQNMSGDPEQEYFADGMVEDITTALSRIKWLVVIARNSSFAYKGKAIDVKQVGRDLGVRYVLEGSVRKAGSRVRITGQLIEVSTNAHLWADRFDGHLEDIFDLQDKVTSNVVGAISPKLEYAEIALARRKPTSNMGAYDYYMRGMSLLYEFTIEAHPHALPLFRKAIELDPEFTLAHAAIAGWYIVGKAFAFIKPSKEDVAEVELLARRLLRTANDDARVMAHAGQALTFVVGKINDGSPALDRAIELDPNLAIARMWGGGAKLYFGEFEKAIEHYDYAMRLSPLDPRLFLAYWGLATALFLMGHYERGLTFATTGIRRWPNFVPLYRTAMACCAMSGRTEEARNFCQKALRLNPSLCISAPSMFQRSEDLEKLNEALRAAGLPE